jgi:hypothetical protein
MCHYCTLLWAITYVKVSQSFFTSDITIFTSLVFILLCSRSNVIYRTSLPDSDPVPVNQHSSECCICIKEHSRLLSELSNLLFIIHSFYCCERFVERSCSNLQDGQSLDCACPKLWSNLKCCYCAPLNWNIVGWNCKILHCHSIGVPKHARKALVQKVWNSVANLLTFLFLMQQKMKYVFCIFSYCCTMLRNCWHKLCIFQRSVMHDFMVLVEYAKWSFTSKVYMAIVWCCGLNSWKLDNL